MTTEHRCKDCRAEVAAWVTWLQVNHVDPTPAPAHPQTVRPIVEKSGGRCATHWRKEKERRKAAAHERRVQQVYGLRPGEYERLYELQGGLCALCRRAKGTTKKLAVDHCHTSGEPRGLCCGPCNQLLGHARDDPDFFARCIAYLTFPPYRQLNSEGADGVPHLRQGDEADADG